MSGLETLAAAASLAGTAVSAVGTIRNAAQQKANDQYQARQLEAQAKAETAAAQREAMQRRKEGDLLASQQQARAAASGGSATDPTVLDLMGDADAMSEYNAATAMYRGDYAAQKSREGAEAKRMQASTRMTGAYLSAGGDLLSSFGRNAKSLFG